MIEPSSETNVVSWCIVCDVVTVFGLTNVRLEETSVWKNESCTSVSPVVPLPVHIFTVPSTSILPLAVSEVSVFVNWTVLDVTLPLSVIA